MGDKSRHFTFFRYAVGKNGAPLPLLNNNMGENSNLNFHHPVSRHTPNVYLVPIGEIETPILEEVKIGLESAFSLPVRILDRSANPSYAFEALRRQYYSTKILKDLDTRLPADGMRIVGIAEVDLCTPVLTFVFGEAQFEGRAAVISLIRLRQEFYQLPSQPPLLATRARKEAVHELGHTFGLTHCGDEDCVIHFSPTVTSIDQKRSGFCSACRDILEDKLLKITDRGG